MVALWMGRAALHAAERDKATTNSPAATLIQADASVPAATNSSSEPSRATAVALSLAATNTVAATNGPPTITSEYGAGGLRLNFRGAPLNLVLDYLSDAAGFVINKLTDVRGTVEVWSKAPVTKDEAVELLSSVLRKNGYAMTRNGRILTIMEQGTVKTANLDITTPYNPDEIESSDEVVTAIIHVRYANAQQLMANLEILLPTTATLTSNESANTLLLVATKTDIKRMLKIINALDTSIASVSSIAVTPLKYADAKETAALITSLFTPQGGSQGGGPSGRSALFSMLGGGFGRSSRDSSGGSGGGNPGGAAAKNVVAVGDDRSNSLVVSAPEDLLETITNVVARIDQPMTDETEVRVFRLKYADPSETADQLGQLFPDPTAPNNNNQNNPQMPFFFGRFGRSGGAPNNSAAPSDRTKKLSKVVAVPDPRTSSLLVTASKSLMPQIADMIAELDSNPGKRDVVKVFELHNADPQDINTVLQDLFQSRGGYSQPTSGSRSGMLGNNNPLNQRETQQQQPNSGTTSFGSGSSGGGGNAGRAGGY